MKLLYGKKICLFWYTLKERWAHLACLVSQSRQNSLNIATDSNIIIKSIIITTIVIDMMITIINMSTQRWGGA